MAGTHYDVLGVGADATAEQIRRAYHDRARHLHPDGLAGASRDDDTVRRAMQDVNEAWRVLRDPVRRAAYDDALHRREQPAPRTHLDVDTPYAHAPAEPGDLTVALVRAAPWVAVLVVLGAMFVFTAFARTGSDDPDEIIGSCITTADGPPAETACTEPNDGRVVLVVDRPSRCSPSSKPVSADGVWWCVR